MQDVDTAYVYRWTAVYKGFSFPASYTGDGMILLSHSEYGDMKEILNLGFEKVERFLCEKFVHPDELDELVEYKDPIWGFQLPESK